MTRIRAIVSGQVQGVGFRWSAREQADRLGLTGYVVNLADGTVETEIEGDEPAVAEMVDWLHHGPHGARVDGVTVEAVEAVEAVGAAGDRGFRIR